MFTYTIYQENSTKYAMLGESIEEIVRENLKAITHIIGKGVEIIGWSIRDTGSDSIKKYEISVQYQIKSSSKRSDDLTATLWADEQPYVKMWWDK